MGKDLYTVGNYLHIFRRGNRKAPIVRDDADWWRFVLMLYYFNSKKSIDYRYAGGQTSGRISGNSDAFYWKEEWGDREPIVEILCFTLMENHYHLLTKEIQPQGNSLFIQKLNTGLSMSFNEKYNETGSLFERKMKYRVIESEEYLTYVSAYIQVKNLLERYPNGGLKGAVRNWKKAMKWALQDPYSSFADYAGNRNFPIIEKGILGNIFTSPEEYKSFAEGCIFNINMEKKLGSLIIE